jgi:hypothetical protein
VGVVEQPITDGVGQGRVPDVIVPLARRQLAGDDRRTGPGAIVEDLEEIAPLLFLTQRADLPYVSRGEGSPNPVRPRG